GNVALCEAAGSPAAFMKLCRLGVSFPTNQYGEYIGYQTDHDTACRATSAGPYTSRMMTECLQRSVEQKQIPIFNGYQVISILHTEKQVRGLLVYSPTAPQPYLLFNCTNIIYATGGPANIYAHSVYPESQMGATGMALEAGVLGHNLTEWQYGLASLAPRWNVSGSYFQVLPRIYSVDEQGTQREFVLDYFKNQRIWTGKALSIIFRKGYQWPFHVGHTKSTSAIDLLVYEETILKRRRVYLDFTQNPLGLDELPYHQLDEETTQFYARSALKFGTPVQRLMMLNKPAYQFYKDHGVDLKTQPLEIGLCAQHNNGGLGVDIWWQTNLKGMFACGEVAGTHGVARPGGSALNAGQVGSARAATYINARRNNEPTPLESWLEQPDIQNELHRKLSFDSACIGNNDPAKLLKQAQLRMSAAGGPIREQQQLADAMHATYDLLQQFTHSVRIQNASELSMAYYLYDTLVCQMGYLSAMLDMSFKRDSRGGALYTRTDGTAPVGMSDVFRFRFDCAQNLVYLQRTRINPKTYFFNCNHRPIFTIPQGDKPFEVIWREYRRDRNVRYQFENKPMRVLGDSADFVCSGYNENTIPD
ncbi:MAG: FAD-binding protein, partial [Clostridia bacterium]|nr:FAD-binding protein [Clostridia bacterium]